MPHRAASRTACTAGNNSAIKMPIIAITTKSSTSVKALRHARASPRTAPLRSAMPRQIKKLRHETFLSYDRSLKAFTVYFSLAQIVCTIVCAHLYNSASRTALG